MAYKVSDYGNMFTDKWRMEAYTNAIKKAVTNKSIVIDLGAGTGIFSFIACNSGAKKVYAIEPNQAINVGIQTAYSNGYNDKIEFIKKSSKDVKLKKKVDIIISDLRGVLPLFEKNIKTIIDARRRFLKPNGILIPQTDHIFAGIINSPGVYGNLVDKWDKNIYNINFHEGKRICLNDYYLHKDKKINLLSERQIWQIIDYRKVRKSNFSNKIQLKTVNNGTAHGILVWFDSILVSGVKLLNNPDVKGSKLYGRAFFPFLKPVKCNIGDKFVIELSANLVNGDYIWNWNTKYFKKYSKKPAESFSQSTIYSTPISPEILFKRFENYKTELNKLGAIDLAILNMISNKKNINFIAKYLLKNHPDKFKTFNDAISYAGDKSVIYSE
jgi:protein arginine N-methyltransferase 1